MDLVSCIISTYKRDVETLKRAVESVLGQTYLNIELIVVNDAPEEKQLCKDIGDYLNSISDARVRYIVHDVNKGACAARNTGAANAKGSFLAFLDDDDEWLPEKIAEQMKCFDSDKVGLVWCDNYNIHNGAKSVQKRELSGNYSDVVERLLYGNFIGSVSFPLIRKSIFDKVNGFDESLPSRQDLDLWIRILKLSEGKYCDRALVNYFVSDISITKNLNAQIAGTEILLEKYKDDYAKNPRLLRDRLLNLGSGFILLSDDEKVADLYFEKARVAGASSFDVTLKRLKGRILRFRRKYFRY